MTAALADRISEEHAKLVDALPSAVIARARRREALKSLLAAGLPTVRDENWKYANLRPLERVRFSPAPAPAPVSTADLPKAIKGYARHVVVDGIYVPELSTAPSHGVDVQVRSARVQEGTNISGAEPFAALADTRFALLNEAFANDSVHISLAATLPAPACVEVLFVATTDAQSSASYPRLHVHVGPNGQLGLIERHISLGSEANFINGALSVSIKEGARVDHYRVQQTGARAVYIDTLYAAVAANARYRIYAANLGSQSARSTLHVQLAGAHSQLALHAVSVADRHQVHDTYALVDHVAAHTRTDETFRGIAGGRSRVAFNGKIVVRSGARQTDSKQSLRGLLAGPEAEIDVRPQLEIYTDDVRCAHGATAGKLDETMLFYLLSRGIDRDRAQQLLKWAFLEDVVSKISVPELRRQIEESLVGRMQESTALKELL
jgi:Fe-S cluster assembly protein SufD